MVAAGGKGGNGNKLRKCEKQTAPRLAYRMCLWLRAILPSRGGNLSLTRVY
jgi:hypothetical protein